MRPRTPRRRQEWLEKAGVNEASYRKALAASLQEFLCDGDANAIRILRRLGRDDKPRLAETGRNASELIDFVMSDKCPVSAALTDDDKSRLREIKRKAENDYPPPALAPAQKPK